MSFFSKVTKYFESKIVFNTYALIILLFLLLFDGVRSNPIFSGIQSINVIFCLYFISKRPGLNLVTSFYGFTLILLCLLPIAEFKMGIIYWEGKKISDLTYIKTSILVLISILSFRLGYILNLNPFKIKSKGLLKFITSPKFTIKNFFTKTILLLIFPCIYLLSAYNFDIIAMQFRSGGESIESVFLFEWFFVKPLIFNICFFYLLFNNLNRNNNILLSLFFVSIIIFFVNPLGVARFLAFSLYIPLIYLNGKFKLTNSYLFLNFVFFGLILIFPILDIFRWFAVGDYLNLAANFNLEYYFAGHFDAFQNFCRIIDLNIHTYGQQFLGAFLFFIPRSIWPNKPVGTGFLLADKAGLSFNNISMPYIAELYLDFTFIGMIIGVVLLGIFYRIIDDWIHKISNLYSLKNSIKLIAFAEFCCLQFYLLRGNFLGAFAFSSTVILTIFLVYILYSIINIKK